MWFPKFPYTNFSQINLDWVLKQVKELSEWMNRYFKQIRQDLDDEINNRIEGDKALGERIDQEITDRTEADQQLQDNIDAEEAAREAADTALGGRIDKEIQDRTNADTALGQRIDTETSERKAADQQLQSNIDTEEAAREAADTALGGRIDKEIQDRTAADTALGQRIDALRSDAILKDGSTTTTAPIPFAKGIKVGSIAENSMGAGVAIESNLDLNNHTISSVLPGSDEFDAATVGQLDDKFADVHSIPAGGSSGQVLAKVDGTNYNVTWVDQQGGGSSGNVPAGGTTGQVLAKATDADYQTEWVNQPEGLPAGGTTGQVVTKTADGTEWANAPSGLPVGGTTGQVVTKTDDGAEWEDVPKELPDGGTDGQILSKTATGTTWIDNIKITSLGRASSSSNPNLATSYFPSMTIIDDYNTKIRHCIIDPPSRIGQTTDEGKTTPNLSQFKNTSKLTTDFIFNNMPENPFKNNDFAYQSFSIYSTVNQGNEQKYTHDFYSINTHDKKLSVTILTGYTSAGTPSRNITPANMYRFILSIPPNI